MRCSWWRRSAWRWSRSGIFGRTFGVVLVVRARLIGRADGRELYVTSVAYRGGARPLAEWTTDDHRALRQHLQRASEALAERIVDEIFLVDGPHP